MVFKYWRCFSVLNYRQAVWFRVWRMQLCSHRYVRITGLLSTPLVLRIGNWLCVLPAITLVVWQVQESQQSCFLRLTGGELLNHQDRRIFKYCNKYSSLPSWQGWEATVYRVQYTFDTSNMSNITLYTVLCKIHKHHLIAFDPLLIIGIMFHTSSTSNMPFDLLFNFKHFTPLTPPTSKSHSINHVDSNSKYSN